MRCAAPYIANFHVLVCVQLLRKKRKIDSTSIQARKDPTIGLGIMFDLIKYSFIPLIKSLMEPRAGYFAC